MTVILKPGVILLPIPQLTNEVNPADMVSTTNNVSELNMKEMDYTVYGKSFVLDIYIAPHKRMKPYVYLWWTDMHF